MKKYISAQCTIVRIKNDVIATSGFDGETGLLTPGQGNSGTIYDGDYEAAPSRFGGRDYGYSRF